MGHQCLVSMPPPPPPVTQAQHRSTEANTTSTQAHSTCKHILLVIKLNHYAATNTANTNAEPEACFPDANRMRLYLPTRTKVLT